MKILLNLFLIVLLGIAGFLAYNLYQGLPLDKKDFTINLKQELPQSLNSPSNLEQFELNVRFASTNLSYFFQADCTEEKLRSTERAFEILSEKTQVLSFYRTGLSSKQADIIIKCSEEIR